MLAELEGARQVGAATLSVTFLWGKQPILPDFSSPFSLHMSMADLDKGHEEKAAYLNNVTA